MVRPEQGLWLLEVNALFYVYSAYREFMLSLNGNINLDYYTNQISMQFLKRGKQLLILQAYRYFVPIFAYFADIRADLHKSHKDEETAKKN